MEVSSGRPGYELWRPNRQKAEAKTTKTLVAFVLLISAALLFIITIGGWERLQSDGVGLISVSWGVMYVAFAYLIARWNRGLLPVSTALAVLLAIFATVAAPTWFARAKDGLASPALPEELLGTLTLLVVPIQLILIVITLVAFNQNWHIEEERPIGRAAGHPEDDPNPDRTPTPA